VSHLKSLKVKPPPTNAPVFKGMKRCQSCFKLSLIVDQIMDAEYECLNCNLLLCG